MPPFVDNCDNDVFVSYACVDDQAGWVSEFVADLGRRLSEQLGRKDSFSIWRDKQDMEGNLNLDEQIAKSLDTSACMLVVLSQGYMASQWCQRERCHFLESIRQRNSAGGQIFVIERDWLRVGKPQEFQNMLGYRFWTGDPGDNSNLPRPLDKRRATDLAKYEDEINRVVFALVAELSRQKSEQIKRAAQTPDVRVPSPRPAMEDDVRVTTDIVNVFLAEVTEDLRPQWKKLRTELDQQRGLRVVSGGTVSDPAATETAVNQALGGSKIFVQLLSSVVGQPIAGSNESYAMMQHRLAEKSGQRILQWRAPSVTEEFFDAQEFEDEVLAVKHRKLLFGQVRAEHLEDFKRRVIELALEPVVEEPPRGRGTIYVGYNPDGMDSEIVYELCDQLCASGFGVVSTVTDDVGDPEAIREDFEKNVLGSQRWIVFYGDIRQKYWCREQLNEINKLLCEHGAASSIILCAGPPEPKEVTSALRLIGIQLPHLKVVDCQRGIQLDRLYPYLKDLMEAQAVNQ